MPYIGNQPYQGVIDSGNILNGSIDTVDLKDGSVTSAKLETLAGLTANTYGSASAIPQITVDSKGRITAISTNAVSIPSGSISVTGGDITMSGNTGTAITNATIANGAVTTAKLASGSVTSAKLDTNITIAGALTVSGNLTVSGTTTTVNSTTLEVADLNVVLGSGATSAAAANGAGITIGNYASNPTILYGNVNNTFAINRGIEVTAPSKITVSDSTSYATNVALSNSDVLYLTNSDQTTTGYVGIFLQHKSDGVALGRIALMGGFWTDPTEAALTFSLRGMSGAGVPVERMRITAGGLVLPGSDNAQDLGSFTARWRNIYTADMHFSNYGSQNSVDGTWGNWTLQEGEESIYMLNNRTGRKYKIVLEEV